MASRGRRPLALASSAKSIIMIAFFFTMPISSTMPISATTREIVAADHEGEQRADAGGGQGGEDGERVDDALVQHAQHDVDRDHGGQDQPGLAGQRLVNSAASPVNLPISVDGMPTSRSAAPMARSAAPSEPPGARSKLRVDGGELILMGDGERRRGRLDAGDRGERHLRAAGADIEAGQRRGSSWYAGAASRTTRYWLACA